MAEVKKTAGLSEAVMDDIRRFRDERGWAPFHNPKDLAISLSIESAELLELFQWSGSDVEAAAKCDAMGEELADILIYAALMADRLGLSLDEIVRAKLMKNAERYPVERIVAKTATYDELKAEGRRRAAEAVKPPAWTGLTRFLHVFTPDAQVGDWHTRADGERFLVNARETAAFWQAVAMVADPQPTVTLAHRGILKWDDNLDVSRLDAQGVVAVLTQIVREARATTGRFERAVRAGLVERALARLAMLSGEGE